MRTRKKRTAAAVEQPGSSHPNDSAQPNNPLRHLPTSLRPLTGFQIAHARCFRLTNFDMTPVLPKDAVVVGFPIDLIDRDMASGLLLIETTDGQIICGRTICVTPFAVVLRFDRPRCPSKSFLHGEIRRLYQAFPLDGPVIPPYF
ncbi:hypothetical protein [Larkinella soli]|uniref:hypothetical protein n=1 Tax=Larkinella soli TaxID=1770527 RepID=UPI000FFC760D|nr:hypothetical protein [Larkinella soli]